jgi:xanthine dehydrogenase YagS FAD-binding subunit
LAHKPWRVPEAEQVLAGAPATAASYQAAADLVLQGARGYGANDFKIPLTRRALASVLAQAVEG